jgi:hypothetical protein
VWYQSPRAAQAEERILDGDVRLACGRHAAAQWRMQPAAGGRATADPPRRATTIAARTARTELVEEATEAAGRIRRAAAATRT